MNDSFSSSFLEREKLKVKLEVFEGPLDLLLYLIRKSEVDIYHVPLLDIINQYLAFVEMAENLDLDLGGEFILMAATLLHIKSRMLLPVEKRSSDEEDDEEDDPRSELIRKLIEYKKFKEVSHHLLDKAEDRFFSYLRPKQKIDLPSEKKIDLGHVTIDLLVDILEDVIQRQDEDQVRIISHEEVRLEDKIAMIRETLQFSAEFKFRELFVNSTSTLEVVVIFFAVLELIKNQEISFRQDDSFSDILIRKKEKSENNDHLILNDEFEMDEPKIEDNELEKGNLLDD